MKKDKNTTKQPAVLHFQPAYQTGLTHAQVAQRKEEGLHNKQPDGVTRSVSRIVVSNVFTLFNLLNVVLCILILTMGDWKNALFIGVAVCNTAIGIFQELPVHHNEIVGERVQPAVESFAPGLEQLLRGKGDKNSSA